MDEYYLSQWKPKRAERIECCIMSDLGLRPRMLIKDIMTSPVVTVEEAAPANKVAELMLNNKVGSVIVVDKTGNAIGIVTERDLVVRVLAKNIVPAVVKAKDFMTTPLVTADPEKTVTEAARMMNKKDIRRLGVLYKGKLVGIVSSKDILEVMPELFEIMQERDRIEGPAAREAAEEGQESPLSGYCDRCGLYSENLLEINGKYLCEDCRIEVEDEK
jgi:signal-transduction protein with cAMP-binding, CBS, and nucleotidyltransferase domain